MRLNEKVVSVGSVGSKVSPNRDRPVMASTSKSVGVNIPHESWKVLVEPSHKYIEANNIQGLIQ